MDGRVLHINARLRLGTEWFDTSKAEELVFSFAHPFNGFLEASAMGISRARRNVGLFIVSSVFVVCGGEPQVSLVWEGTALETENGWTVQNPESPLGTFLLEPIWSKASDEWGSPSGLRASGEHVSFIDRMTTTIHLLHASDGSASSSFGREGEGPGELGRLYSAAILEDQVFVSHSGSLSLSACSLGGEFQGRVEWGTPVGHLDRWVGNALVGTPLNATGRFVEKQLKAEGKAQVVGSDFQSPYPAEEFGSCLRATAKAGWMVRVLCSALRVRVEGPEVPVSFWIEHPSSPAESSVSELDQYVARYWAMQSGNRPLTAIIQRQLDGLRERARVGPTYSAVRIDPGSGWMIVSEQPFGDQGWVPAILHLFLMNGVYLGAFETEFHIKDFDLSGGRIFVLARDPETDLITLHGLAIRIDSNLEASARSVDWEMVR